MLTRLLVLGASAILATVAAAEDVASRPVIDLAVLADGAIKVEGREYSTQRAIHAEIKRLSALKPRPNIRVTIDKSATYGTVAILLANMQRDGAALRIGIVNTWNESSNSSAHISVTALPDGSLVIEGQRYSTRDAVAVEIDMLKKRTPEPDFQLVIGTLSGAQIAKALAIWPNGTPLETRVIETRD